MRPWITAFGERLRDLGWIEDCTIAIAYRWAQGHPERYAEIAAEFVRLKVNLIVTTGPAAPEVKKAMSVIPIVLALSGDPVGAGHCESSATGWQHHWPVDAVARYCRQATRTVARGCRQFSPVSYYGQCRLPDAVLDASNAQAAAQSLGIEIATLEIRRAADIVPAFESLKPESLTQNYMPDFHALARR
jgi:ABC-type uncharacterized transport system substrate-binding protein